MCDGRVRFEKKEKVERREGALDDISKGPDDMRRSGSSVCEKERHYSFRPVSFLNNLYKKAERMQLTSEDLALTSAIRYSRSKPLKVNMRKTVELEPLKKIDEIRRAYSKELGLTIKLM